MLEVEVKTDSSPSHNGWTLRKTESDSIAQSFNEYNTGNKVYYHTKCISNDNAYIFTFFEDNINGSFHSYYKILINGIITKEVNVDNPFSDYAYIISKETIICNKDEDCKVNDDICDIGTCNISNKQCSYDIAINNCKTLGNKATLVLRVITLDTEPILSLDVMKNSLFGVFGKEFTMKS